MVEFENFRKWSTYVLSNLVALTLVGIMFYFLVRSAWDKTLEIPTLILSLGSGAVGFYLKGVMKEA